MSPSHTFDAGKSEGADDIRTWHAHEELPVVVRGGLRDLSLLQPVLEVKVVLPNHNRDQDVQRPEKKYVKPERDPLEPLKWHFVGVKSNTSTINQLGDGHRGRTGKRGAVSRTRSSA